MHSSNAYRCPSVLAGCRVNRIYPGIGGDEERTAVAHSRIISGHHAHGGAGGARPKRPVANLVQHVGVESAVLVVGPDQDATCGVVEDHRRGSEIEVVTGGTLLVNLANL